MATDPANDIRLQKERAKVLNEINLLGAEFNNVVKDTQKDLVEQLRIFKVSAGEIDNFKNGFKEFNVLAKKAATLTKSDLKNRKTRNQLQSDANKAADRMVQLEAKIAQAKKEQKNFADQAEKASGEQKKRLQEQADAQAAIVDATEAQQELAIDVVDKSKQILELTKKITKAGRFFQFFSDLISDVPVLGTVFNNLTKAAELFDASMAAGESRIKATLRGLGEFIKLGAKALAVFAVQSAIKGMNILDQAVVSINRNLVMAGKSGSIALENISAAAARTGMTLEKLLPINQALNETFGTSAVFSKDTLTAQSLLVNKLGLSAEEGAKLFKETAGSKQNVGEFVRSTADLVTNFNKTNDSVIGIKTILQDVSHASATTSINTAKFPGGIRTAALEARRLGTSLEKTNSLMEGFLDFESSIQAEMDAELFTGRQLNLERVRAAALSGDQAELARQIRLEAGSFSDFQNLNLLQQQKLAAAFNMSADDLGAMLKNQKAMGEASKENAKEGGEQAKSGEELINKLQSQVTLGESFASSMEQIQLAFGSIISEHSEDIKSMMTTIANKAKEFVGYLDSEDGKKALDSIKSALSAIKDFATDSTLGINNLVLAFGGLGAIKLVGLINTIKGVKNGIFGIADSVGGKSRLAKAFGKEGIFGSQGSIAKAFQPGSKLMSGISNFAKTAGSFLSGGLDKISGVFSGGKQMLGNALQKVNPMNALKGAVSKAGGIGKVIGKIAKFPLIATALEGAFAYSDIQNLIASGATGRELDSAIGRRAYDAIGTVLGSIGGSILGTAIPGPGNIIGGLIGAFGGPYIARGMAQLFDPDYSKFGNIVSELPFFKQAGGAEIQADDFTIRTNPADTITMAGGTKLGGNVESLLEELIALTREGKVIKMDTAAVGRSLKLNASKLAT